MPLNNFIGQKKIVENVQTLIEAGKKTQEPFPHTLIQGSSGLGKTTLANLIAEEINLPLITINAAGLKSKLDVVIQLCNIDPYTCILIDECHQLSVDATENLYTAMEENPYVTIPVAGSSPQRQDVPPFTLIGATTEQIRKPMLDRFQNIFYMQPYSRKELVQIISTQDVSGELLVDYCRENPRIAKKQATWVKNYCLSKNLPIDEKSVKMAMDQINVFEGGLNSDDVTYLRVLKASVQPMGVTNIVAHTGFSKDKINEIENWLVRKKFLYRTPRGRLLSPLGHKMFSKHQARVNDQ